jgi:cytochrome c oxidase cbb3-type subunit 3
MSDFYSVFWNWYIIVIVVASILGILALVVWQSVDDRKGEKAAPMGHVWDEDLVELNNPLPGWWLKLFYLTLFFAVAYLTLYPGVYKGALNWTEVGQYQDEMDAAKEKFDPIYEKYLNTAIPDLEKDPAALKIGQRLFMTYCTNCHGSDARGQTGFPNLTDNDWLYGGAPEQIETTITSGRNGMMPTWGPVLGNEGVHNVAQYVMSLSGRKVDEAAAAKGKEKFGQLCAACHGPDGKGNQMIGAPNLTDNVWLYGGSEATIVKTITNGRQGHMPAHGEFLGKAKVHLLAAYIHSLSQPKNVAEQKTTP